MRVFSVKTINFRIPGPSFHEYLQLPPVPPAPLVPPAFPNPCFSKSGFMSPHIEMPHTMRWVMAWAHKLTTTVQFDGWRVVQQGHDVGGLIVHISIPPPNLLLITTIPFSKFKVVFGSATVVVNKKPAGGYFPVLAPPVFCNSLPCCLPAIIPPIHNILPVPNTVWVGMTFFDFLGGWLFVAIECGADLLWNWLGMKAWFKPIKDAFGNFGQNFLKKIGNELLRTLAQRFAKKTFEDILKRIVVSPIKGKIDLPFSIPINIDLTKGTFNVGSWSAPIRVGVLPGGLPVAIPTNTPIPFTAPLPGVPLGPSIASGVQNLGVPSTPNHAH